MPNHNTVLSGAGHNVIDVIDTATRELVDDIAVPANPHWIVFGNKRAVLLHGPHVRHRHGPQCQK